MTPAAGVVEALVNNWVDVAILGIVAWNVANGVRRGLVSSAVDLAVFVLSISVALAWNLRVADWVTGQLDIPSSVAQPLAFGAIWLITGLLLGMIGGFLTGPFDLLLRGSALDLMLGIVPAAAKGVAVSGFAVILFLNPPSLLAGSAPTVFSTVQEALNGSKLAPRLADGISTYEGWVQPLLAGTSNLILPNLNHPPAGTPIGGGNEAKKRILPGGPPPAPRPPTPEAPPVPPPPTTGQGFPREIYDALDLLDRAGDSWVRDTVNRWVTDIRFLPSGDAAGHLRGTGYFGVATLTSHPNGSYYGEIVFAESQRNRGRFLAGWLAHEATHVWQANTDLNAYNTCTIRESQAYLLQGYVLLDLFGGDLGALKHASGVYGDEIRYATAASNNDMNDMVAYVTGKNPQGFVACP